MLGLLRKDWAPLAYHVSFKLETNEEILAFKAVGALRKYDMHCVVANELHSRRDRVMLISLSDDEVGAVVRQKANDFSLKVLPVAPPLPSHRALPVLAALHPGTSLEASAPAIMRTPPEAVAGALSSLAPPSLPRALSAPRGAKRR